MLLAKLPEVQDLHVPLTPDDTSQAIGAVYQFLHESKKVSGIEALKTPYLGRDGHSGSSKLPIINQLEEAIEVNPKIAECKLVTKDHIGYAAKLLSKGAVLGNNLGIRGVWR